jgi:hypothetical protein
MCHQASHTVSCCHLQVSKEEHGTYCIIPNPKLLLADPVPAHVTLPPGLQPL